MDAASRAAAAEHQRLQVLLEAVNRKQAEVGTLTAQTGRRLAEQQQLRQRRRLEEEQAGRERELSEREAEQATAGWQQEQQQLQQQLRETHSAQDEERVRAADAAVAAALSCPLSLLPPPPAEPLCPLCLSLFSAAGAEAAAGGPRAVRQRAEGAPAGHRRSAAAQLSSAPVRPARLSSASAPHSSRLLSPVSLSAAAKAALSARTEELERCVSSSRAELRGLNAAVSEAEAVSEETAAAQRGAWRELEASSASDVLRLEGRLQHCLEMAAERCRLLQEKEDDCRQRSETELLYASAADSLRPLPPSPSALSLPPSLPLSCAVRRPLCSCWLLRWRSSELS